MEILGASANRRLTSKQDALVIVYSRVPMVALVLEVPSQSGRQFFFKNPTWIVVAVFHWKPFLNCSERCCEIACYVKLGLTRLGDEPHVKASKGKKAARNHDPLPLVANSYANFSYSHASPSLFTTTILYGRVDIQSKNVGYAGNGNMNAGRTNQNQATNAGNGREQMLLATKYEAGVHLDEEDNDFMLVNAYGDDTLEELNASVIMMTRIQPTDDKSDTEPTYDVELTSEVNASQIDMINGLLSKSDHEH
ncbi:hypothetical protein Tco_0088853 [Tanacetum coccineum]